MPFGSLTSYNLQITMWRVLPQGEQKNTFILKLKTECVGWAPSPSSISKSLLFLALSPIGGPPRFGTWLLASKAPPQTLQTECQQNVRGVDVGPGLPPLCSWVLKGEERRRGWGEKRKDRNRSEVGTHMGLMLHPPPFASTCAPYQIP